MARYTHARMEKEEAIVADRFHTILAQLSTLHDVKRADYGLKLDPYQNFRSSEKVGITPWLGAFVRLMDKVQRIQKFARDGKLKNESVIDSFNDLAVYAVICRILYEEEQTK